MGEVQVLTSDVGTIKVKPKRKRLDESALIVNTPWLRV